MAQRILDWLHDTELSQQPNFGTPGTVAAGLDSGRKRKRPALADMSANISSASSPETPRKHVRGERRGRADESTVIDSVMETVSLGGHAGRADAGGAQDINATPRPANRTATSTFAILDDKPALEPGESTSSNNNNNNNNNNGSLVASSSTSSRLSNKRKRTPSPTKTMNNMRLLNRPVLVGLVDNKSGLTPHIVDIVQRVFNYSKGRRLLHQTEYTDHLRTILEDDFQFEEAGLVSDERSQYGTIMSMVDMNRVINYSRRYIVPPLRHEPAWNCAIHFPVLESIRRSSVYGEQCMWENITGASLDPSLLSSSGYDIQLNSRKVDFALVLPLPDETSRQLADLNIPSINPTMYPPLCDSWIAILVETKTMEQSRWDEAQQQLSSWLKAQTVVLQTLASRSGRTLQPSTIPPRPALFVNGSEWVFLLAEEQDSQMILWQKIDIGDTKTTMGMLKLNACLQYLIFWAVTTWQPWLQHNILDPLLAPLLLEIEP